jgi:LmbE family N-acetylglucosaminyl deacetylase
LSELRANGSTQALVDAIHQAGFRVIRFDNRDIGLSQHLDHRRISGARLVAVEGMGHDLPPGVVDRILQPLVPHLLGH